MNKYKGIVTYRNDQLLYFILDDSTILNAAIYSFHKSKVDSKLPSVGSKVQLDNVHSNEDQIENYHVGTLCFRTSEIEQMITSPAPKGLNLIWMIDDYKIGAMDLFQITKAYETVKNKVSNETNAAEAILSYVEGQLFNKKDCVTIPKVGSCERGLLDNFDFKTISMCRQVDITKTYPNFPYWSFGTRWYEKEDILVGYLFAHEINGMICIKDNVYTVGCVIGGKKVEDLVNLLNKTVYIEGFCVFTEIFNPNPFFNLEYLYIDCSNIKVVECKRKRESLGEFQLKMTFLVLNKSNVMYSQNKGYHFWLEIEDFDNTYLKEGRRCYLCFPRNFIEKWCCLDVSYTYTLYFEEDLKRIFEIELERINSVLPQYIIVSNDNKKKACLGTGERKLLPITNKLPFLENETVLTTLLENKDLFGFQAVLKSRKFSNPISSRTKAEGETIPAGFGNLGTKTHILEFQVEKVKTLCLYLNNWERMVMPVGLIPGVLVNVRNVQSQKNYCKCTALTSIEVVEYKPKNKFQTANLFDMENNYWGPTISPKDVKNTPSGVLAHIRVQKFNLKKFSMRRLCSKCELISKQPGEVCVTCKMGKMVTSVKFSINVVGYGTITCNNLDQIKKILNFGDKTWEQLNDGFELIGMFDFSRQRDIDNSLSLPGRSFTILFNNLLKLVESKIDSKMSLLCRKLECDRSYIAVEALWFLVDAKFNI